MGLMNDRQKPATVQCARDNIVLILRHTRIAPLPSITDVFGQYASN